MIQRHDQNGIAILRMEHGKANAIDTDLFDALNDQLDQLETSDVSAVVLTGTGSSFSAGVDLFQVVDGGADYLASFLPALSKGLRRLFTLPKPVVAAVNGHAIAGGCLLAVACDYRVMARGRGKIGVTELLVGVPFPAVAMEVLRYQLSDAVAQKWVYSGALVGPDEAQDIGWVDELADAEQVLDRAIAQAVRWGKIPGQAFAMTKLQLRQEAADRMERQSVRLDEEIARIWSEEETLQGIRDFMANMTKKS